MATSGRMSQAGGTLPALGTAMRGLAGSESVDGGRSMTGTEHEQAFDEPMVSLGLPAGTVIRPHECGVELPDGRYLRVYEDGVREELPDGRSARREDHMRRPQLLEHRYRLGGNPHGYGPHESLSYRTGTAVEVLLPLHLSTLDDSGPIGLMRLVMERVVALELRIAVDDGDVVAEFAEGQPYAHVIDLSMAGLG